MYYLILLGIILIYMIMSRVYMFEEKYLAEAGGKPITYPLFKIKSNHSFFCWLIGIDLSRGWVSPIYRGLLTFYITSSAIALEIGIGLGGCLIGVKNKPPYVVFSVGNRLGNHIIE